MSFDQNEDAIVGSLKQSLVCWFWSCYCSITISDFSEIKSMTFSCIQIDAAVLSCYIVVINLSGQPYIAIIG